MKIYAVFGIAIPIHSGMCCNVLSFGKSVLVRAVNDIVIPLFYIMGIISYGLLGMQHATCTLFIAMRTKSLSAVYCIPAQKQGIRT